MKFGQKMVLRGQLRRLFSLSSPCSMGRKEVAMLGKPAAKRYLRFDENAARLDP